MPLQGGPYHVDWIFSNTSDCHVAKDREWFFNYTPFNSQTTSLMGGGMTIEGVGDVRLEVNTPSNQRGVQAYATLVLRNVLHCPSALTNILGQGALDGDWTFDPQPGAAQLKHNNSGMAYLFDRAHLYKAWLVGHPKGQTCLDPDGLYYINVLWAREERTRFMAHKKKLKPGDSNGDAAAGAPTPSTNEHAAASNGSANRHAGAESAEYFKGEKDWIKKHYENEYKFLLQHGVKINEDEDREEGRRIVRAMMSGHD